ncbi:hypothetical protein [Microcoleus sp. FACHB-672]|uniref:hypothetical protein n=1 Tax=Microcoleus sp. FACHB-672 TaxID=2692825 RepID=UPI001F555F56|nr:hypothetical protein [Microcoleus sp. FACHB-672]
MNNLYLANLGVPLFAQSIGYQILLLIPIIIIEAFIYQKMLKISQIKAIWVSFAVNIISTIAGIIVLLFLLPYIVSMLLGYYYLPVQSGNFPFLPVEIMVTLIPMFFASVALEFFVGSFLIKSIKNSQSFWIANGYTYLMLEMLAITQLIRGYIQGRG